jgi:HAMP domain-containing protein
VKGYSERDEKRILDALGRGLLKEFPNPDRAGCPGSDVLRKIAYHEMPLTEAKKWLDHLTSCSPCYGDFSQFQAAYQSRRTRTLLAIAASILIVASLAAWALFLRHSEPLVAQTAVVDLRNRSIPRGTEQNPAAPPLEVNRAATSWNIYLPLGSSEGPYDVRVMTQSGESVMTASSIAKLADQITSLKITVTLSSTRPGRYTLQLRGRDLEWNSYAMLLR